MAGSACRTRGCCVTIQIFDTDRSTEQDTTMKHSRPGFTTRINDGAPSKVRPDMKPALARKYPPAEVSPVLQHQEAMPLPAEAEKAIVRNGPEVIANPKPSATPVYTK